MYCWIEGGAALPHPTAPPARDGSIDELGGLGSCVFSEAANQRSAVPWYSVTMVKTTANPRKSTPPQFIRRMDWKFANAVAVAAVTVLSPGVAMC